MGWETIASPHQNTIKKTASLWYVIWHTISQWNTIPAFRKHYPKIEAETHFIERCVRHGDDIAKWNHSNDTQEMKKLNRYLRTRFQCEQCSTNTLQHCYQRQCRSHISFSFTFCRCLTQTVIHTHQFLMNTIFELTLPNRSIFNKTFKQIFWLLQKMFRYKRLFAEQ